MTTCPQAEQLADFLHDQLEDFERSIVVDHVENCPPCQKALGKLANDNEHVSWYRSFGAGKSAVSNSLLNERGCDERKLEEFLRKSAQAVPICTDPAKAGHLVTLPTIAGYEILDEIGRGGMGVVYKARQISLHRIVAIKMILDGASFQPQQRERFLQEARTIASLKHANIVEIHEIGSLDGKPFFSLEYASGGNLAQRMDGTPWLGPKAAGLVGTLARAVDAAHQQQIIHRDLKPANILFYADGIPKITDFGLAKHLDRDSHDTRTGMIIGTPSYMAPEQADISSRETREGSDIYSLGVMLYELLTGRPPFKGITSFDTILQLLHDEPVPPRRLQPKIPRDLETICLKCIEKSPQKRYRTAALLAEDLDRFLKGQPIQARPVGKGEQGWKWVKRYPARFALIAVFMIGLVVTPSLFLMMWQGQKSTAAAEHQARIHRYFHNITLADREWSTGQWQQASDVLEDCAPSLRRWEWHHLKQRLADDVQVFRGHQGMVTSTAWSADGKMLATAGLDGTVHLWDAVGGREIAVLRGHEGSVRTIAFGSDSRLYSGGTDGVLRAWDTSTLKQVAPVSRLQNAIACLTFCPRRQLLAAACSDLTVRVWDTMTGLEIAAWDPGLPSGDPSTCLLSFTPDGQYLATTATDRTQAIVKIWAVADHREVFGHTALRRGFAGLAFSPDGQTLAVISNPRDDRTPHSSELVLFDWSADLILQKLRGHMGAINAFQFSPSGRHLATTGIDRSVRIWDSSSAEQVLVLRTPSESFSIVFSPDGNSVAVACQDSMVRLFDTKSEQGVVTFSRTSMVNCVTYSPSGSLLASAMADGAFIVQDARDGREVFCGLHKGPWRGVLTLSFNAAGDRLASAAKDDRVSIWSLSARREVFALPHAGANCVLYSPDGRLIASAGDDHLVKVWDALTRKELVAFPGHTDIVFALAFSPDGLSLASAARDKTVRLWSLSSGTEVLVLRKHPHGVPCVAFSPDGKHIASASHGIVKVWDATTGKERATLPGHTGKVAALAWSPDGKRLASASDDKTVKIWDPAEAIEVLTLTGHRGGVASLTFDPTGELLTSAGWDGTVKTWNGRPFTR